MGVGVILSKFVKKLVDCDGAGGVCPLKSALSNLNYKHKATVILLYLNTVDSGTECCEEFWEEVLAGSSCKRFVWESVGR